MKALFPACLITVALLASPWIHADPGDVLSSAKIADAPSTFLDPEDRFGIGIANVGDLDGDGITDLAIGSRDDDTGGPDSNRGAVWVVTLNANGSVKALLKYAHGSFGLTLSDDDSFGLDIDSLGTTFGGVAGLVVGAPGDDTGGTDRGAIYVLNFNAAGILVSIQKTAHGSGSEVALNLNDGDGFGVSVAALPDIDGDGVRDLAAGAPGDNEYRGAVYILFMNADGSLKNLRRISDTFGGLTAATLAPGDFFGLSVASIGDADADGVGDLAVGAPFDSGPGIVRGAIYILYLRSDGRVKAFHKIADGSGGIPADSFPDNQLFGISVESIGDINRDGIRDLAVGSSIHASGLGRETGACFLLRMNQAETVSSIHLITDGVAGIPGGTLETQGKFGVAIADLGDFNRDGVPDIAVGSSGDDTGGSGQGAVYLLSLEGRPLLDGKLGARRNPARHRGNQVYHRNGRRQTQRLTVRGSRRATHYFSSQNDNNVPGTLFARAAGLSRRFDFTVFRLTGRRRNVTAAVRRGLVRGAIAPGGHVRFQLRARNTRSGGRVRATIRFHSQPLGDPGQRDTTRLKVVGRS